uniref:Sialic acid synthase n=1 Tax=Desulfovibrio sp. U5L TaxID=596152 RepID=I2Q7K8_9BACT
MSIFIIAEIGINHNGNLLIAKDLIKVAKNAGCDAVKFQKRTIDKVYSREYLNSPRDSPWGNTQRHQKEGLEFNHEDYRAIDAYCADLGIEWFASAWDMESQDFLDRFELRHNKVASAMVTDRSFLEKIAAQGKHTFVSTGMCTTACIDDAVAIFRRAGCPFELMHTVSTYPMQDEDANLRRIVSLRERYGCDVGYSGHETGLAVSYAATALGITSLERHITLDRAMYGSDQAASLEPAGLSMLVGAVRKIEKAMGDGGLDMQEKERTMSLKLRGTRPFEGHEVQP